MAEMRAPKTHCVHRWAHNEDPSKSGRTGNCRYDGMAYYLYATCMAVKYPKQGVVVVADDGIWQSPTTTQNRYRILHALPSDLHAVMVDCDTYGDRLRSIKGVRKCHDDMKQKLRELAEAVVLARHGASQAVAYERFAAYRFKCNEVVKFLKRKQAERGDFFTEDEIAIIIDSVGRHNATRAGLDEKRRQRDAARQLAWEAEDAKRAVEETGDAELWRRHEYRGPRTYWSGTYVRLSRDGRHVETSKDVVVPFADALQLFRLCRVRRAKAECPSFIMKEMAVGDYSVQHISDDGSCVVGCHRLSYDEMERCFRDAESRQLVPAQEGAEA